MFQSVSGLNKRIEELNMVNITTVNFGKHNGNFTEKPEHPDVKKVDENRCLTIRQSKDILDLVFDSADDLNSFCCAMKMFQEDEYVEKDDEYILVYLF